MTTTNDGKVTGAEAASVVREFASALGETTDDNIAAFERFIAPDIVWDTGSRVLHSLAACLEHLRTLPESFGVAAFRVHVHHLAAEGRFVLTERVDDLIAVDGTLLHETKVMGVFEVDEGRITAWRDYYDTAGLAKDLATLLRDRTT